MKTTYTNRAIEFSDTDHSNNTIENYLKIIMKINLYIAPKQLEKLDQPEIEQLVTQYICSKELSVSYQNMVISAIKFYFKQKQFKAEWNFARPKRMPQQIKFLCTEEIKQMLDCTYNLKNKCILLLLFATGLKSSQLLAIKRGDVNLKKGALTIKEKKEREILMPENLLAILKSYLHASNPRNYLFEGNHEREALCERSLQVIIKKIGEKAGIKTAVSANIIRNSYAIHMLDMGADLLYVNRQMGHNNLRSTMRYSAHSLKAKMISPLDRIDF